MKKGTQTDSFEKSWSEVARASKALGQAGDLIQEAHAILDRFCSARDQGNWDQAFPWKISELRQAQALCQEIATHLNRSAPRAQRAEKGR